MKTINETDKIVIRTFCLVKGHCLKNLIYSFVIIRVILFSKKMLEMKC
jgi:hypothetical protein